MVTQDAAALLLSTRATGRAGASAGPQGQGLRGEEEEIHWREGKGDVLEGAILPQYII